ncbi:MAG: phospholipase D-like domain-containing protein [Patescibacteria group bacterium]|jgi:phosphatidylserine/phosphatidylglycerophosphate/cardiolipin synthase-like enzyme
MIWLKILIRKVKIKIGDNFNKKFIVIALPLLLLILCLYLGLTFFRLYQNREVITSPPARTIEVNESFSANLYFNDELGLDVFSELIVNGLDAAKNKIELAMYSMDNSAIRDALYRAAARGVSVDLVFSDKHQNGIENLFVNNHKNLKISFVSSNGGSMHHKFLLIDRGSAQPKLFFGSYNFTNIQGKYDPSFILTTERPELISLFGDEFDRLAGGLHGSVKKSANYNPYAALIRYPEGFIEIWFSPGLVDNNIKDRMLNLIRNSRDNIKIMTWSLTDKDVAAELALKSKQIPVSIITDDYNWSATGSAFPVLAAQKNRQNLNNLEIITDSNRNQEIAKILPDDDLNSFLHHHLLVLDDRIAVFGTNNWSSNGFFRNDESVMITNIKSLVKAFEQSYTFNYNKNK